MRFRRTVAQLGHDRAHKRLSRADAVQVEDWARAVEFGLQERLETFLRDPDVQEFYDDLCLAAGGFAAAVEVLGDKRLTRTR